MKSYFKRLKGEVCNQSTYTLHFYLKKAKQNQKISKKTQVLLFTLFCGQGPTAMKYQDVV